VYQASAEACSACVVADFPTYAAGIASILTTNCAGNAATVASVTTAAAPTTIPTGLSQTQPVTQQTSTTGGVATHSGARGGFEGITREYEIVIIMAIAIVASFWSLFM
jgi:hypothetical protein